MPLPSKNSSPEPIRIEGVLVRPAGRDSTVGLLLGPYYVELSADDILDFEVTRPPLGLRADRAQAVVVTLRRGARLLDMVSARSMEDQVFERSIPFSLRTRSRPEVLERSRFEVKEAAFFETRGARSDGSGVAGDVVESAPDCGPPADRSTVPIAAIGGVREAANLTLFRPEAVEAWRSPLSGSPRPEPSAWWNLSGWIMLVGALLATCVVVIAGHRDETIVAALGALLRHLSL